ncbi:MAG: hypothetical protein ACRERS_01545, partial [Methylococcales bacterium]
MKKTILIGTLVVVLLLGCLLIVAVVMNNVIEKKLSSVAHKLAKHSNLEITDIRFEKSWIGATG